jgi:hypothetical protein
VGEAELLERGCGRAEDEGVSAREEGEGEHGGWAFLPVVTFFCDFTWPSTSGRPPLNVSSLGVRYMGRAPRSARRCSSTPSDQSSFLERVARPFL